MPINETTINNAPWRYGVVECPHTRSGHLWKFLQLVVEKEAEKTFRAAQELNGLEAWRSLVWEINSGRDGRQWELGERVRHPPSVKSFADVSAAISAFDTTLDEFSAAGGTRPSEMELKQCLLRSFPQDLRESLMLKATEPDTYEQFKAHVRTKLAFIMRRLQGLCGCPSGLLSAPHYEG